MPTFGSLFSGIGGLDLGLERAGWKCKWQVEIDEWCRRVLSRHWPDVPRWDDAKTFPPDTEGERWGGPVESWPNVEHDGLQSARLRAGQSRWAVDLICGGFPCQPVSLAGRRRGQDDERWLWPEFARIVRVLRPRFVLVENVPGLLARGMGDILGDLAACGYQCEWDCIPAAAVGAPHLRYRVFIVAYADEQRREAGGNSDARNGRTLPNASSQHSRSGGGTDVAYADDRGWPGRPGFFWEGWRSEPPYSGWWTTEPDVGRVAHGIPRRVDRLRGLGNAVVPQVAEWSGRRLMEAWESPAARKAAEFDG